MTTKTVRIEIGIADFAQLRTFQQIAELNPAYTAKGLQRRVREAIEDKYLAEAEGRTPPEHVRRLLDCIVMDGTKRRVHLGKWSEFMAWQMTRPVQ